MNILFLSFCSPKNGNQGSILIYTVRNWTIHLKDFSVEKYAHVTLARTRKGLHEENFKLSTPETSRETEHQSSALGFLGIVWA